MDTFLNIRGGMGLASFMIVAIWTLLWKGLALWQSAKRGQRVWFCILLVVSTFGILEIIYLFFVLKMKPAQLFTADTTAGETAHHTVSHTEAHSESKSEDKNEGTEEGAEESKEEQK